MKQNITLITPTQGNPEALKRTIDSLKDVINEVVVGSVCIYPDDEEKIKSYGDQIPLSIIQLPFNHIFKNGFASTLNTLASYASNDLVLYMNVGEILVSDKNELKNRISPSYTYYYLVHPTESHHWGRLYNRKEVQWTGIIHEELVGNIKPCSVPILTFDDTPKDGEGTEYWAAMNTIKEACYFNLYIKLIDQPHLSGGTNRGWFDFSRDGYHSFIERLHQKGDLYEAFIRSDYEMLINYLNSEEFKNSK